MTSPPTAHQVLLFGSDAELLTTVVPFLRDGQHGGDAVVLALNPREEQLVLHALEDASRIQVIGAQTYTEATGALHAMEQFLGELVRAGAAQVRIVGSLPEGFVDSWDQWAEYESGVHEVLERLPVQALCVYDRSRIPEEVAEHACRLHPTLARPFGMSVANPAYVHG